MSDSVASLLLAMRAEAEAEAEWRRRVAAEYEAILDQRHPYELVRVPSGGTAGYLRYPMVLSKGMYSFADPKRAEALGAAPSYPKTLPTLAELSSLVADAPSAASASRTAEMLSRRLVTLPTHSFTTADERRALVDLLVD